MKKTICTLILILITILIFQTKSNANIITSQEIKGIELTEEVLEKSKQDEKTNQTKELLEAENMQITTSVGAVSQDAVLGTDYWDNICYVPNDKENIYYIKKASGANSSGPVAYFEIEKQNIKTQKREVIAAKGKDYNGKYKDSPYYFLSHYELGNMIYIQCYLYEGSGRTYDKLTIFGFDVTKNQFTYSQEFAVTTQSSDQYPSFAVDNAGHFYFVQDFDEIVVFNKNGTSCYKANIKLGGNWEIIINSISPNGKALFYSVNRYRMSGLRSCAYNGIQKLNNGKFVNTKNYTAFNMHVGDEVWHFIDSNSEYAINQYGEIAKFNYDGEDETGISYKILSNAKKYQDDYSYGYSRKFQTYAINENYIYVIGNKNKLYIFDKSKNYNYVGKIENILDEDEEKNIVETIIKQNGNLNIIYKTSGTRYLKTIDLKSQKIKSKQSIIYNTQSSQKHTKEQIKNKYNNSMTFNYYLNHFDVQMNTSAPYNEGKIKQPIINDGLNRINFYRWMYGINEVTLNKDKMARSQKGAFIQLVNNQLSHTPSKPAGMSDAFYKEAYAGCNAKHEENDTYSGNCGYNHAALYTHIDDYVDDSHNSGAIPGYTDMVGHRWSILDPNAYQTSFGYCSPYSTVSMYYKENTELKENFYAYPTAGYFPNNIFNLSEYWSIYFKESVTFEENYKLEFIYNGKSYPATNFSVEVSEPAIVFKAPDELRKLISGQYGTSIPNNTKITVKLSGLTNNDLDDVTYQYDVTFFDINKTPMKGDVNYDGKIKLYDAIQILRQSILNNKIDEETKWIMDWNDDGKVKLYDALQVLRKSILG